MHQNLAVILRQFNYGKNSFVVLIPGCPYGFFDTLRTQTSEVLYKMLAETIEGSLSIWQLFVINR